MKKTYFLLTEQDDTVIGVVGAISNEELNEKATIAINEHFDQIIPTVLKLNMEDSMFGNINEVQVKIDFDDDEDYIATIFIQQVFIY
jgi:hypothetical protein